LLPRAVISDDFRLCGKIAAEEMAKRDQIVAQEAGRNSTRAALLVSIVIASFSA